MGSKFDIILGGNVGDNDQRDRDSRALRTQACATGVLLLTGEVWNGVERRTSRLLFASFAERRKEVAPPEKPSIFFG
jgi:hypothetical protein